MKPSSELTREQAAAIVAAEETMSRSGEKLIAVRMGDKRAVLKDLGAHLGPFKDHVEHRHEHDHLIESAARELHQRVALLTSRAREGGEPPEAIPLAEVGEQRAA